MKRYDKYPVINFYFDENGLTLEEVKVIKSYLARMAYHFQSTCKEILYENERLQVINLKATKSIDETLSKDVTVRKVKGNWVIYNGSPRGNHSNSKLMIAYKKRFKTVCGLSKSVWRKKTKCGPL